jgi:hypothetical protein
MKVDQFLHIMPSPNLVFYIRYLDSSKTLDLLEAQFFEKKIQLSHKITDGHPQWYCKIQHSSEQSYKHSTKFMV